MKRFVFTIFCIMIFGSLLSAADAWSVNKDAGITNVCYHSSATVYCAVSENKKAKDVELKNYLSVFLQFGGFDVNTAEMVLHPGIVRLIKSSRSEQYDRVLRGIFDYLIREKKRAGISISSGTTVTAQNSIAESELVDIIESVNWPKYLDSTMDSIRCTDDSKILLNLKITNSMKRTFIFFADEAEVRILGSRTNILSVGTIAPEHKKLEIKQGESVDYAVSIIFTGEMDKSTRYSVIPYIKGIQISKDEYFVLCNQQ